MKERFKKAIKLRGYSLKEVAEKIGLKYDTLRKALNRNSINDGYLILIEKEFGISKSWLKKGIEPIFVSKEDILMTKIEEDVFSVLESIDEDKIVAYLLLKETQFIKNKSFMAFVEKLKATKRLIEIANKSKD